MFVGVDTYHDSGKIAGRSVVAVVGTMNNDSTETHSRVFFQSSRQEIGSELGANVESKWPITYYLTTQTFKCKEAFERCFC